MEANLTCALLQPLRFFYHQMMRLGSGHQPDTSITLPYIFWYNLKWGISQKLRALMTPYFSVFGFLRSKTIA